MDYTEHFPSQKIPSRQKTKEWGEGCVKWADKRTYFNYSPTRHDVVHMKVNYDLLNGQIHMEDIAAVLNPGGISTMFIPDKIQHYPILNSKINTLRGEEAARAFDWRVIVTNPYSISQIEEEKRAQFNQMVQGVVEDTELDPNQANQQIQEGNEFFSYNWQDMREIRANELLKHYSKEQNFKQTFSDGFVDAMAVGQEVYQCGIVGGEPVMLKLNPIKLRAYKNGYSSHIEDADVIIYEDYWSPGRIVDTYYDELTAKDIKWLSDDLPDFGGQAPLGAAGNVNESYPFIPRHSISGENGIMVDNASGLGFVFDELSWLDGGIGSNLLPYDVAGNIRVLRVYWKSKRKILSVKSFDPETGDEVFDFYPETYIPDTDAGEKADTLWVNEAWEGTMIGENIFVGIRPCIVQHNTLSNPSKCDFGIVGTIYNINESRPFSLVDMMKPYNYLYDAVHAKLVDLIATNWGKLLEMDLALKPKNWEVEKWMYFARANKVLIKDSFNEGNKGAATGKLAGGLNNASKGYIDADWGNSIQNYLNILQWTKDSMSDLVGINRQREGNTYNRETVGGIERAVLQSSYITDWLFQKHEDTKRRVLEEFLEYCKASLRGRNMKFQYILSDGSRKIMDIPGDEFAESSYGLLVDNSQDTQKLESALDSLAQAATQNNYRLASIMRLYSSTSIQEKIRLIEKEEKQMQQQQQEQAQMEQQMQQMQIQAQQQTAQMQMQQQDALNQRDNETKIRVAEINAQAEYLRLGIYAEENDEQIVHEKLDLEREKLRAEIEKFDKELRQKDDEREDKLKMHKEELASRERIEKMKLSKKSANK